jgi:hypothetical protein
LWLHTADTRRDWTSRLLRRVEQGAYRMAGENQAQTPETP